MKAHLTRNLLQFNKLSKIAISNNVRQLTTTTDPKNAMKLALSYREQEQYIHPYQESIIPEVQLPNASVFNYLLSKAPQWQNLVSLECALTGKQYTYSQLIDGALKWSAVLDKVLPNEPAPTIAFLAPNSPEFVVLFCGCLAHGATVSPINPIYTPNEICHHLENSNASMLVVDAVVEPLADIALQHLKKNIPVFVIGSSIQGRPNVTDIITDKSAPLAEPKVIDPSNVALLPYSSGTTGKPKGVKLSHAAITNNMSLYCNDVISGIKDAREDGTQDIQLGILPFFHIFGLTTTMLASLWFGGKLITMPMFDPASFTATLKKHKMTSLQVVPSLLQFIAGNPHITKEDLSSLHSICVGAAPVPVKAANQLKEKAPDMLFQEGYGMTEILLSHATKQDGEKIGYCGQLLPNCKAKIIDIETGETLAANEKGELLIQTPAMMSGYHNNEKATKETIDEEGWLHTGDVAFFTEDGYYSIVDRIKELIKVKGLQVSPSELEETLVDHPSIEAAGIVGIPHSRYGEVPVAYIVRSDPITEDEVNEFISSKLAAHKQLTGGIHFIDQLPVNATGKLLRRVLKHMAMEDKDD